MRPHRRQPTRLPRPWDSPGKNTRVGCHCLLQCMKVKSESEVAQSCPTPSDPTDCSLPGSSIHGVFQERVLIPSNFEATASLFSNIQGDLWYFLFSSCQEQDTYCFSRSKLKGFSLSFSQFSLVTQSCPTLCNPMDCSTPGFPVQHQLPELVQTHVHWIDDAIQPSHPLSSPSHPVFNLSQHQGFFQWVNSLHQVASIFIFRVPIFHQKCDVRILFQ